MAAASDAANTLQASATPVPDGSGRRMDARLRHLEIVRVNQQAALQETAQPLKPFRDDPTSVSFAISAEDHRGWACRADHDVRAIARHEDRRLLLACAA